MKNEEECFGHFLCVSCQLNDDVVNVLKCIIPYGKHNPNRVYKLWEVLPTLFESTHFGRLPNQTHLIQLIILFQNIFKTWSVDGLLGGPSENSQISMALFRQRDLFIIHQSWGFVQIPNP